MQLLLQANPLKAESQKSMVSECWSVQLSTYFSQKKDSFLGEGFYIVCNNETVSYYEASAIQVATMHLICPALSKSIQRWALEYRKSDCFRAMHFKKESLTAANPKGISLQNSAVIRLETFQVFNHRQEDENWEREMKNLSDKQH